MTAELATRHVFGHKIAGGRRRYKRRSYPARGSQRGVAVVASDSELPGKKAASRLNGEQDVCVVDL